MNDSTVFKIHIGADLEQHRDSLTKLFESWKQVLGEFGETKELGYWYGERANTSILAGAAYRLGKGCRAVEEFNVTRKYGHDQKGSGRCDAFISLKDVTLIFEAKDVWPENCVASNVGIITRDINSLLEEAADQLKCIDVEADLRFAVCYVVPNISSKKSVDEAVGLAKLLWEILLTEYNRPNSIVAIYESREDVIRQIRDQESEDRIRPGVAIVMKKVPS